MGSSTSGLLELYQKQKKERERNTSAGLYQIYVDSGYMERAKQRQPEQVESDIDVPSQPKTYTPHSTASRSFESTLPAIQNTRIGRERTQLGEPKSRGLVGTRLDIKDKRVDADILKQAADSLHKSTIPHTRVTEIPDSGKGLVGTRISIDRDKDAALMQQAAEELHKTYRWSFDALSNAPDFASSIEKGLTVKNPDPYSQNRTSLFGWKPFYEEPKNKVSYAFTNARERGKFAGAEEAYQSGFDYEGVDKNLTTMTPEEQAIYTYFVGRKEYDKADRYLDSIYRDLQARGQANTNAEIAELSAKNPALGVAYNLIGSVYSPLSALETVSQNVVNKVKGKEEPVNPNSALMAGANMEAASREGLKEKTGAFGDFLIDTGLSMAQFISKVPLGNAAALAVMASSAGGQAAQEIAQRGGTAEESLQVGIVAGIAEAVFEKFSLENLAALKAQPVNGIKTAIYNVLKSSFTEGSEEVATEITNIIADTLIMQDNSNYNAMMEQFLEKGMDEQQAQRETLKELAKQVGMAYAGGALSGGVIGGGMTALNYHNVAKTGKQVKAEGLTPSLLEQGLSEQPDSEAYTAAKSIQEKQAANKKVSNFELGNLYAAIMRGNTDGNSPAVETNRDDFQETNRFTTTSPELPAAQGNQNIMEQGGDTYQLLREKGVSEATARVQADALDALLEGTYTSHASDALKKNNMAARELFTELTGVNLGTTNAEARTAVAQYTQDVRQARESMNTQQQVQEEAVEAETVPAVSRVESLQDQKAAAEPLAQNLTAQDDTETRTRAEESYPYVDLDEAIPAQAEAGQGDILSEEDLVAARQEALKHLVEPPEIEQVRSTALERYPEQKAQEDFVKHYTDNQGIGLDTYRIGYDNFYRAGLVGLDYGETVSKSPSGAMLTSEARQDAYAAGVRARNAEMQKPKKTFKQEGGLMDTTIQQVSGLEQYVLDEAGKHTGLRFHLVDGKQLLEGRANGMYQGDTGDVYIAADAENFISSSGHELTHFLKDSTEQYQAVRDTIIKGIAEGEGLLADELIERYRRLYSAEQDITTEELLDEIVADATEAFMTDPKVIRAIAQENRTVAEKIRDFFRDLADVLEAMLKGNKNQLTTEAGKALAQNAKATRKAADLWVAALNDAAEKHSAALENVKKVGPVNSIDAEKAKYSIRLTEDDIPEYMRTAKRGQTREKKAKYVAEGNTLVLTSQEQIESFIIDALLGKAKNITKAYGKVNQALADAISQATNNQFDVSGYYLEFVPDDLQHSYEHKVATEKGNIALGIKDFLLIPEYIDTFDDLLSVVKHKDESTRVTLGKKINGYSVIAQVLSTDRSSLQFKTMYGVTTETYLNKIVPNHKNKNSLGSRGKNSQQDSSHNTPHTDPAILTADSISQGSEGSKPKFSLKDADFDYQKIKQEYEAATDEELKAYIDDVLSNPDKYHAPYKLKPVMSEREIADIKAITGVDITGYSRDLPVNYVEHISKRHGRSGTADKSMSDSATIARMQYIIDNYDTIIKGSSKSKQYWNSDKTKADTVVYIKRINGYYYVAEAVPDSKNKKLHIISAYTNKAGLVPDASLEETSGLYGQTELTSASTESISQDSKGSKPKFSLKDIRFQLKDIADVDTLTAENEKLKDLNAGLMKQFELTGEVKPNQRSIRKVADFILKKYSSAYNKETLVENLTKLFDYIANNKQVDGNEIGKITAGIAKKILQESGTLDTSLYDTYKDMSEAIRKTPLVLSEQDKADLSSVGGYNAFRKQHMGQILLTKEGQTVDSFYQELAAQYPEFFDADTVTHPADQLMSIADALEAIQPTFRNENGANMDEMAGLLAHEIYDSYFNITPEGKTFADQKALELNQVKARYKQRISELRQEYNNRYKQRVRDIKAENKKKIAALKEKQKAATAEQKAVYNERIKRVMDNRVQMLRAQQAKYKERLQRDRVKMAESQEAKKYRNRIIKNAIELSKWLLSPTDRKHVPEKLQQLTAEVLKAIDFSSARTNKNGEPSARSHLFYKLADQYTAIIESSEGGDSTGGYMEVDQELAGRLKEFADKTETKRLEEMSAAELRDLSELVDGMKHSIRTANKLISKGRFKEVSDVASSFQQESRGKRTYQEKTGVARLSHNLLNLHMLDADSFFAQLGDTVHTFYRDTIRKGFDRKVQNTKAAADYIQNLLGDTDIKEWSGKQAELHSFQVTGGNLSLTTAQIMGLYELSKREQAKKHILIGGIKQAPVLAEIDTKILGKNVKKTGIVKSYAPVKVNEGDIQAIVSTLSAEQRRIADGIAEFFKTTAEWGNETSLALFGYRKFLEENYYPIVSDSNYLTVRSGDIERAGGTVMLKNLGFTKKTVPNADNPLIIEDIFDVFTRQADQMGSYNAFVVPLSDLQKFLSYKSQDGWSVQQEIERTLGSGGKDYITNLMRDINGSARQGIGTEISNKLLSNMKAASVGANLRVIIQQPTAIVRAAAMINPKYLIKGIGMKGDFDLVKKYAPIAQWKDWGFFEMDTGRQMKEIFMGTKGMAKFREAAMAGAGKADNITWAKLWNAVELETRDLHPEMAPDSETFYQTVGERFSEIVDRTQVVDSVLHRTQMMRSKDALTKMTTSFMSEPMKSYNMLRSAGLEAMQKRTPEAKKAFARTIATFISSSAATALVASIIDGFRDDDDDEDKNYWDKYLDALGGNLLDGLNPLSMIPYLKEMSSLFQGYEPQRMEMAGLVDVFNSGKRMYQYFAGDSKYTFPYLVRDMAESISKLTGVPIKNAIRTVNNTVGAVVDGLKAADVDTTALDYYMAKLKFSVDNNKSKYISLILQARENGDTTLESKIKQEMVQSGFTSDEITSAIKAAAKKELLKEALVAQAAEARQRLDTAAYQRIILQLTDQGYDEQTEIIPAINSYLAAEEKAAMGEEPMEEYYTEPEEETGSIYDYDMLFDAQTSGNTKVYEEIYADLRAHGKDASTIKAALKSRRKKLIRDFVNAYQAGDYKTAEPLRQKLLKLGWRPEDIMALVK